MKDSSIPPPPTKSAAPVWLSVGAVLLVGGGFLFWQLSGSTPLGQSAEGMPFNSSSQEAALLLSEGSATAEANQAASEGKPKSPQLNHALPPPPDLEELEALEAASAVAHAAATLPELGQRSNRVTPVPGCSGSCGAPSPGVTKVLRRQQGAARGCYQSGLRQNSNLQGKLTVGVRVSPSGKTCWAKALSDTLGDPAVTACIVQKFRAATYPSSGACVQANVPLNFVAK